MVPSVASASRVPPRVSAGGRLAELVATLGSPTAVKLSAALSMGAACAAVSSATFSVLAHATQIRRVFAPSRVRTTSHGSVAVPVAHAGSLMRLATLLGAELGNGDLLGTIHDLHGRQRYGVHATFVGGVGAHRTFASVRPGDILFTVFLRLEGVP